LEWGEIEVRIGIKYFTTCYLRGEVARGRAGGGTDTIEFLLENFQLLALLIDKDGALGRVGDGKVRANQNVGR
jgi:hypothetical protein